METINKYNVLISILDNIIKESPDSFKSLKEDVQKRSKAFIHMYLKAKYGILDFQEREKFICDDTNDGGLDAYYIDDNRKEIIFIQSKFQTKKDNFEKLDEFKNIVKDLSTIEINRIMGGKAEYINGQSFNKRVINFQEKIQKIKDIPSYKKIFIILANVDDSDTNRNKIMKIVNSDDDSEYQCEIFNFKKIYNLVFLLCSGNYFDPVKITISINLENKKKYLSDQTIDTKSGKCKVAIIFVPTKEIGRILYEYQNSILKYNPRNYLSLSNNKINKKIKESIIGLKTNDFAILNNGITILAKKFYPSKEIAKLNVGQVVIENPQIINGGQTAYVLSEIYKNNIQNEDKFFHNKEVMLKIIELANTDEDNLEFIETISRATNEQTVVKESDRRSNDKQQIELQSLLFYEFSNFYERKRGEFFDEEKNGCFKKDQIIKRDKLVQSFLAFNGNASGARGSIENIFKEEKLYKLLDNNKYKAMLAAYNILLALNKRGKQKSERNKLESKYGFNLQYSKMAMITAIGIKNNNDLSNWKTIEDLKEIITKEIKFILSKWKNFEKYVKQQKENKQYIKNKELDKDNYYKGRTLNKNIDNFFKITKARC